MNPFGGSSPVFGAVAPPAPAGFGSAATLTPNGVSVPVEFKSPDGSSVTVDMHFGAEHAANPQALMGLVQGLFAAGFPVRVYVPKPKGFGGPGGGGGFGGGNGFGGGGFGGGGRRW